MTPQTAPRQSPTTYLVWTSHIPPRLALPTIQGYPRQLFVQLPPGQHTTRRLHIPTRAYPCPSRAMTRPPTCLAVTRQASNDQHWPRRTTTPGSPDRLLPWTHRLPMPCPSPYEPTRSDVTYPHPPRRCGAVPPRSIDFPTRSDGPRQAVPRFVRTAFPRQHSPTYPVTSVPLFPGLPIPTALVEP